MFLLLLEHNQKSTDDIAEEVAGQCVHVKSYSQTLGRCNM